MTPRVAARLGAQRQQKLQRPASPPKVMLPGGKAARGRRHDAQPGARRAPCAASAREGREAFYEGAVARDIVARLKELGGLHEEEDFAAQRSKWVEPIHASYRGYESMNARRTGRAWRR